MHPSDPAYPFAVSDGPTRPSGVRRAGYRPAHSGGFGTRLAAVIVAGLLIAAVAWFHFLVQQDTQARAAIAAKATDSEMRSLVGRTAAVGGTSEAGAKRWIGELRSGSLRTGDLLLRVFTGTSYLIGGRSDRAFARDVYFVLTGREPDSAWLDKADVFFINGGSRTTFLGTAPDIAPVSAPEGSVRSLAVTSSFPRIGLMTVGIATAEGQCRIEQVAARTSLYVDGRLRSNADIQPGDQTFQVDWDTRSEDPGNHDVVVLLRSSDGRGRIVESGSFTVPRVYDARDGSALAMELIGHEQWFYLTPQTRDVMFNANIPSGGIAADLFRLDSSAVLSCDNRGKSYETLRLRGENDAVYFARVTRGADQVDLVPITYTVTMSDQSIRNPLTGDILAVQSLNAAGTQVTAANYTGGVQVFALSEVELIDYTARLSALDLRLPDGSAASLYPAFHRDITEYGLYLPAGVTLNAATGLAFFAEAQEGDAAGLEIVSTTENGLQSRLYAEEKYAPARSENNLEIRVTGFDGSRRTYTLHILYGPHTGGYDTQTLLKFPSGYQSGLWLLHVHHPAYVFEPFETGILWNEFISIQDETNRSLILSNAVPSAWVEPESPVYDGTAWKAAIRPVIEHFADPRNFLSQENLFQFEKLAFDPKIHTLAGIEAILKGTFMEEDSKTYADIFLRAGKGAGISPYFLASRAVQEMGSAGQSQLAHGTLPGYEGFYNYFNIGSYPNPSVPDGQRINGALFAMYGNEPDKKLITPDETAILIPWDTAEKSILGGALYIANRYIVPGQNTLYFQKFDVIPEGGLYTKQYAQNIQMAWAEGRRSFNAYKALGLLNAPLVFSIPFFRDMPATATALP